MSVTAKGNTPLSSYIMIYSVKPMNTETTSITANMCRKDINIIKTV